MQDVAATEFCFSTPRMIVQKWWALRGAGKPFAIGVLPQAGKTLPNRVLHRHLHLRREKDNPPERFGPPLSVPSCIMRA
jgi:hypothetical protein